MNKKILDTIIGENQPEAIKNITLTHSVSIICYIKNVSNKLNKNLSVTSLELIGILTFLLSREFGCGDKFLRMVEDAYT